jgi:hypothetical protein
MYVKWKLISLCLEIVLASTQDRCTVCAIHTIGLELFLAHPMYSYVTWIKGKLITILLEIVLISALDGCTVCVECNTGMENILGTPDGTPW